MVNNQEDVEPVSREKYKQKASVFGSVLGEGKLWIKLSIPKKEQEEDEMDDDEHKDPMINNYSNGVKRVCHVCNKPFSSGKALGGHMRIHVQRAHKRDLVGFKEKLKANHGPREQAYDHHQPRVFNLASNKAKTMKRTGYRREKPAACIICGKNFPSMKSLFGHMRCHPEREWRGIKPPAAHPRMAKNSCSVSSLSDVDDDDDDQTEVLASDDAEKTGVVDLTESLRGWPVTARRGRKVSCTDNDDENDNIQLREAVNYLMMLKAGSYERGLREKQKLGEAASSSSKAKVLLENNPLRKLKSDKSPVEARNEQRGSSEVCGESTSKSKGQECVDQDFQHHHSSGDDQLNGSDCNGNTNGKVMIKSKKKRKKIKLSDLEIANNDSSPVITTTPVHRKPVASSLDHKYRCDTCDKSFPNGRALGGHRSSHNKIKISIHNTRTNAGSGTNLDLHSDPTARVESPPGPGSLASDTCRRLLDFDLNEAPPSSWI